MHTNLKKRRKELNLTLKDVADKVGVSIATVSRWETGNIANMRKDRVYALAQVLQVDSNFILGVVDEYEKVKNLNSYSTKTFEEFLNSLDYEEDINMSLVLNKSIDENSNKDEIEVVKVPKNAYKKFLDLFKTFKD